MLKIIENESITEGMNTWVKQNAEHWLSSVQLLSRVWFFLTLCSAALQASLSITNSQSLLKLVSIELVMPSNHLILCCPLLLLPSTFPSIRETLTTQQLSKEGIKSRIIQPPCVTGGKKEILVVCFFFFWTPVTSLLNLIPQSHSPNPNDCLTQKGKKIYILHIS